MAWGPLLIILGVVLYVTIVLYFDEPTTSDKMNYGVVIGTILLGTLALYSTLENKREAKKDRTIRFVTSQLEDLYGPIIAEESAINEGFFFQGQTLEIMKKKRYLARAGFDNVIQDVLSNSEEFRKAAMNDPTGKCDIVVPEDMREEKERIDAEFRRICDQARTKLSKSNHTVVEEAKRDYAALRNELTRMYGGGEQG